MYESALLFMFIHFTQFPMLASHGNCYVTLTGCTSHLPAEGAIRYINRSSSALCRNQASGRRDNSPPPTQALITCHFDTFAWEPGYNNKRKHYASLVSQCLLSSTVFSLWVEVLIWDPGITLDLLKPAAERSCSGASENMLDLPVL